MTTSELVLAALLHLFPHMSHNNRACIEANRDHIVRVAEEGLRDHGVPPLVMISVGFMETHLGCDVGEGGNWGAPISRAERHRAGTPGQAAQALQTSREVCGTWLGAISRFKSGLCRIPPSMTFYTRGTLRLMNRLSRETGLPMPESL